MQEGARGRDQFNRFKGVMRVLCALYSAMPLSRRQAALRRHQHSRGRLGLGLRYAILKSIAVSVGDNVAIFPGVHLLHPEHLSVGSNVSIQPMVYMECEGGVAIGNDVSIAHGASLLSTEHRYSDRALPIRDQGVVGEPVRIEDNVWIGAKATVLSGVTVQTGCVIGAGAVLSRSTEPNGVYAGVPARRIKER